MAIFIPKKKEFWQRKPATPQQLREGHWSTDGLTFATIFDGSNRELVEGRAISLFGNAYVDYIGAHFDETGDYLTIPDVIMDSVGTVTHAAKCVDNIGTLYQYFFSFGGYGDANSFNILTYEDDDTLLIARSGGPGLAVDENFYPENNGKHYSHAYRDAGVVTYLEGRFLSNINPLGSITDGSSKTLYLGGRTDLNADRFFGGSLPYIYIHNRELSADEIASLYEAPYQILKPKKTYFQFGVVAAPTATLSGSATASITETDINDGGKEIILDLTNDTWVAGTAFDDIRQDILNGLVSAQNEQFGWNNIVTPNEPVTSVVRTSSTIVTITLEAH